MRCTALTTLFFALFVLFSAVAYAAPVTPQGAIVKRQTCNMAGCRDAVNTPSTSSSDSTDPASVVMGQILAAFYKFISPSSSTDGPPAAYAVSGTSSAPAGAPTGL